MTGELGWRALQDRKPPSSRLWRAAGYVLAVMFVVVLAINGCD